jgi:hypothetical protein
LWQQVSVAAAFATGAALALVAAVLLLVVPLHTENSNGG